MLSKDTEIEVLNDHYKDSFTHLREYLKLRDRLFLYVLLVFVGMFLLINGSESTYKIFSDIANEKLGATIAVNSKTIDSILWFILLSLVIRYYQTSILVERQYVYLSIVENELNSIILKDYVFQREGKAYANYYKLFPEWAWIIYTFVFPALLILVSGYKLVREIFTYTKIELTIIMDVLFFFTILATTIIYMISYHYKK